MMDHDQDEQDNGHEQTDGAVVVVVEEEEEEEQEQEEGEEEEVFENEEEIVHEQEEEEEEEVVSGSHHEHHHHHHHHQHHADQEEHHHFHHHHHHGHGQSDIVVEPERVELEEVIAGKQQEQHHRQQQEKDGSLKSAASHGLRRLGFLKGLPDKQVQKLMRKAPAFGLTDEELSRLMEDVIEMLNKEKRLETIRECCGNNEEEVKQLFMDGFKYIKTTNNVKLATTQHVCNFVVSHFADEGSLEQLKSQWKSSEPIRTNVLDSILVSIIKDTPQFLKVPHKPPNRMHALFNQFSHVGQHSYVRQACCTFLDHFFTLSQQQRESLNDPNKLKDLVNEIIDAIQKNGNKKYSKTIRESILESATGGSTSMDLADSNPGAPPPPPPLPSSSTTSMGTDASEHHHYQNHHHQYRKLRKLDDATDKSQASDNNMYE